MPTPDSCHFHLLDFIEDTAKKKSAFHSFTNIDNIKLKKTEDMVGVRRNVTSASQVHGLWWTEDSVKDEVVERASGVSTGEDNSAQKFATGKTSELGTVEEKLAQKVATDIKASESDKD